MFSHKCVWIGRLTSHLSYNKAGCLYSLPIAMPLRKCMFISMTKLAVLSAASIRNIVKHKPWQHKSLNRVAPHNVTDVKHIIVKHKFIVKHVKHIIAH